MSPYAKELGIPGVLALGFLLAARHFNRGAKKKTLAPDHFRAPCSYIVTVAGVAIPLIGALLVLQPPERIGASARALLLSGLLLFLIALVIGAWLTYAIISHAEGDKVELNFPQDWPYLGALGVSYVSLVAALINVSLYFATGLAAEAPQSGVQLSDARPLIARPRPRIGDSKDDLAKALGSPDSRADGGLLWAYHTDKATLTVRLSADGHITSITEAAVTENAK